MNELIWNTTSLIGLVEDAFDSNWKFEVLVANDQFETSKIKIYHNMFGQNGPFLVMSGVHIPRTKNETFNPDNCVVDGINIGDDHSIAGLSISNQKTFLNEAYLNLKKHLNMHGFDNIFDHTNDKPDDSEFNF